MDTGRSQWPSIPLGRPPHWVAWKPFHARNTLGIREESSRHLLSACVYVIRVHLRSYCGLRFPDNARPSAGPALRLLKLFFAHAAPSQHVLAYLASSTAQRTNVSRHLATTHPFRHSRHLDGREVAHAQRLHVIEPRSVPSQYFRVQVRSPLTRRPSHRAFPLSQVRLDDLGRRVLDDHQIREVHARLSVSLGCEETPRCHLAPGSQPESYRAQHRFV